MWGGSSGPPRSLWATCPGSSRHTAWEGHTALGESVNNKGHNKRTPQPHGTTPRPFDGSLSPTAAHSVPPRRSNSPSPAGGRLCRARRRPRSPPLLSRTRPTQIAAPPSPARGTSAPGFETEQPSLMNRPPQGEHHPVSLHRLEWIQLQPVRKFIARAKGQRGIT